MSVCDWGENNKSLELYEELVLLLASSCDCVQNLQEDVHHPSSFETCVW